MTIKNSPPVRTHIFNDWQVMLGDAKYEDVIVRPVTCLSPEIFQEMFSTGGLNEAPSGIVNEEARCADENSRVLQEKLRGKRTLGSKPLRVIYNHTGDDFRKVYEYGETHEHGTVEDRAALLKAVEAFPEIEEAALRKLLEFSSNSSFINANGKARTHD